MVRGEECHVDELVKLLKVFGEDSRMESAYWFDK